MDTKNDFASVKLLKGQATGSEREIMIMVMMMMMMMMDGNMLRQIMK